MGLCYLAFKHEIPGGETDRSHTWYIDVSYLVYRCSYLVHRCSHVERKSKTIFEGQRPSDVTGGGTLKILTWHSNIGSMDTSHICI